MFLRNCINNFKFFLYNQQAFIMKQFKFLFAGLIALCMNGFSFAQAPVTVGGAMMYPTKNIIQNAMNSKDHTTLVAAVKAAGLVETLEGPGPFTVFAPTNEAFAMLPAGTVDNLLKPENKATLTAILTYHVVSGKWDAKMLMAKIKEGNGSAQLTTVQGGTIWAMMKNDKIMLKDEKGNMATVTIPNVYQSNGVIFVIDRVLMPK
jgi:uncharacterized surface protein with fasciclin (FAS1) repeats